MAEIYLAGGCFWGLEEYFSWIEGVEETLIQAMDKQSPPTTSSFTRLTMEYAHLLMTEKSPACGKFALLFPSH